MALKFKLVMRKNLGEDHESIPGVWRSGYFR